MASDSDDNEGDARHEPRECMACRGSGRVISNLGGSPSEVECPWCAGEGVRLVEIDAQAHWPAGDRAQAAESSAETSSADA